MWDQLKSQMSYVVLDCSPAPSCRTAYASSNSWKTVWDGGVFIYPSSEIWTYYADAAIRFEVDPSQALWLNEALYALNYDFRSSGTGYAWNSQVNSGITNSDYFYTQDEEAFTIIYPVAKPYWTASEESAWRDRTYNDIDSPIGGQRTTTNQDAGNIATHAWVLTSGNMAAGTTNSTQFTLPAADPHYGTNGYYVGAVAELHNGSENYQAQHSYGVITSQVGGVVTASGGFSGNAPSLDRLADSTYAGGFTGCAGTVGQTVGFGFTGGSYTAYGYLTFTGTNTLGTTVTIVQPGAGYSVAPTTATLTNGLGNATCSGGTGNFTAHMAPSFTSTTPSPPAPRQAGQVRLSLSPRPPTSIAGRIPVECGGCAIRAQWLEPLLL